MMMILSQWVISFHILDFGKCLGMVLEEVISGGSCNIFLR